MESSLPFHLACVAEPSQFHMDGFDRSHRSHSIRGLKFIPGFVVDIPHEPAFAADEMVVSIRVGIKARSLIEESGAKDDPLPFEQAERAVYGVKRKSGDPLSDSGVNCFHVRMLIRARKLTVDLSSLVGRFDAVPPAPFGECPDSSFNLFGFDFHGRIS
jgi:hypothetical protein